MVIHKFLAQVREGGSKRESGGGGKVWKGRDTTKMLVFKINFGFLIRGNGAWH